MACDARSATRGEPDGLQLLLSVRPDGLCHRRLLCRGSGVKHGMQEEQRRAKRAYWEYDGGVSLWPRGAAIDGSGLRVSESLPLPRIRGSGPLRARWAGFTACSIVPR